MSAAPAPVPTTGEGRPSAIDPTKTLDRRVPPLFAFFFYGFPTLAAWVLLYNSHPGRSAALWSPGCPLVTMGSVAGLTTGLLLLRALSLRFLSRARSLESEFGWILGRQRKWECILLAVLSGVAEEYLFRGWLQTTVGLWWASLFFAVLHWPLNRNFILWPVFAFAAGLAFGWVTEVTGNLLAAAAAHSLYNAVAMWKITNRFREWDSAGVEAYVAKGARA